MSLYRKYRPQSFEDVVGREHIVATLEGAVKQGKLGHAYLFSGTRGTGKTTIARILAKHMLTQGIEDTQRKEMILKGVEEGNLVDLVEIDAASNRGIDDVRSLLEKIQFTPAVAAAKVFIIDEVHMLTKEAFNALLKTLEEPPPYAFFILATTELHKIPATIQSRCQRFVFGQIKEDDIVGRLQYVAGKEKIDVDEEALRVIARHVQGGMRDALALLDQLRSLPKITVDDVKERTGETGHEYVSAVARAIDQGDRQLILDMVRKMEEMAVPFETFARLMLQSVREELHRAVDAGGDTALWLRRLDVLLSVLRDIRSAPVPALVVESALLSLCQPSTRPSPVSPASPVPPVSSPSPSSQATGSLEEKWPDIVKDTEPASARMSLKNGRLKAIDGNTLLLSFVSAFHCEKVMEPEHIQSLEAAILKHTGKALVVKCVLEADAVPEGDGSVVDLATEAANIF